MQTVLTCPSTHLTCSIMTCIRLSSITAALLTILGVAGYVLGGFASVTALIPAFFAVPIFAACLLSLKNETLGRRIAITFGILGAIAPLGRLIPVIIKGEFVWGLPTISQILMIVICAAFAVLSLTISRSSASTDSVG